MEVNQRKAGVLLAYTLTGTNVLVGFIYIPLLIYFLGQEEYGLYQLMGSFLVYLGLFDFGLSNTITRYYSKYMALKDEKGKENLLALSSIIYTILTIILLIFSIILYFYLDEIFQKSLTDSEIITAKYMYIVIVITTMITIPTSLFNSVINANERFVFLKLLSIVQTIIRPFIVLTVFMFEANALILVIIQALINLLGIIFKIHYSFNKLQLKIKYHYFDKNLLKELFHYSFFIFVTMIMDQIFWRSDQIILGILVGTASVAVYSIGSQIVMYYMSLSLAMSGVFLPNITKRVMHNATKTELTDTFIRVGRLQYILLGAVVSGFILFGKEFISVWVGDDFTLSYYITIIIMIPFTIDLIQNIGLTILKAKNMYSFRAIVFLGMALLNITISIPLAMYYGGIGTAAATGASYIIGNGLIMNIYYYKKVGLNVFKFWKNILKLSVSLFISFIMGVFINLITIEIELISLLFKIILYIVIYILVIWRLGMNNYEKKLILNLLRAVLRFKK
ncbi:oligosaccharide flippase family protein [Halobacillus halophilus]|uniref:oligosaccharide flippase family protein n=1 Tax=Halobacillus halophilus TaxID=1570 RepID=UPI00136EC39F|nr:oligosaccharide flippase family protein [Halobacillus halophilus]MYL30783.1 oligosaccharide flippase family protein [Halobacillus halophilus]